MAENELAKKTSDLVNRSMSEVIKSMDALAAEGLINLTAAVDQENRATAEKILDQEQPESQEILNTRDALREINRLGENLLETNQPLDKIWEMIGNTQQSEWRMMWPAIHRDIMIALYMEATDEDTDSISADQAQEIYDYSQDFITETHVIYKNQLCEVTIARGPSGTLGINYLGKTKMVNRTDVTKIDEHVLGMTQMPHLGRIMELAGVQPSAPVTASAKQVFNPDDAPIRNTLLQQIQKNLQEIANLEQSDQQDASKAHALAERLVRRAQRLLREYQNNSNNT
jgi:hypothetical protein